MITLIVEGKQKKGGEDDGGGRWERVSEGL